MKVVIDGVFFQLASTGIARVWSSILPLLAAHPDVELVILDRGNCPNISNALYIQFPSYSMNAYTADDSLRLDRLCRELKADIFVSTYYTSVTSIVQVLMVYDMIPEVMGFDLTARPWKEKQVAISFSQFFACISSQTALDLCRFYPDISSERVQVIPCGIDHSLFKPSPEASVGRFRQAHHLDRDYFLFVGSREQHNGYKNSSLLFNALKKCERLDFDIVCVGGEPEIEQVWRDDLLEKTSIRRLSLSDVELADAYSGAAALIYPSLYEGFGMPVIEAMACGCPVVTTHHGSLREVAQDAAIVISGRDENEILVALDAIRRPDLRALHTMRGRDRAAHYDWKRSAEMLHRLLEKVSRDGRYSTQNQFFSEWSRLRTIQANVDVGR